MHARMIAVALLCSSLAACSPGGALSLLAGGPKVAANVQAGKTNTQTIGKTEVTEQKLIRPKARTINQTADTNRVRADRVETVVVQEVPIWLIIAFAVALFLDSPLRWPGQIVDGFRAATQRKRQVAEAS